MLISFPVSATITTKEADYALLMAPATKYIQPKLVAYTTVEAYTKTMFSDNEKIRISSGFQNYKVVKNLADMGNPYAQYNASLYRIINQKYFDFEFGESLLLMKKAADAGVLDAKYSLGMLYQSRSLEISKLLNTHDYNLKEINKNSQRLLDLSYQYVLEAAFKGHEPSFMMSCNLYVRGVFLERSSKKAGLCYANAIRNYQAPAAYGILEKLYFDDPVFATAEYERAGFELAKTGALLGDTFAMSVLGLQMIYPEYSKPYDTERGIQLIKGAYAFNDPTAILYAKTYFDGSWRLLKPAR